MEKSNQFDIQKLNSIIKSIINIKKCYEQHNIKNSNNLKNDDVAQAACTQFITNIYENKKKIQDETYNKLVKLNKIKLAGARHIANHDYDNVNFMVIYSICNQLTKGEIISELHNIISEIENAEAEKEKKKKVRNKMETTIDSRIIEIISSASKYPSIKRIGIFGSYARGSINQDSDMDLLYDYDETKNQSTDELLGYIEEINDDLINCAKVSKIDYIWYKGLIESNNLNFRDNVLKEVIWAYEQ